jgi:hypothetical protein
MVRMTSLPIKQPTTNTLRWTQHHNFIRFINFNLRYPNMTIRIQTCAKLHQNSRLYFSKPVDDLLLVDTRSSLIAIFSELLDRPRD